MDLRLHFRSGGAFLVLVSVFLMSSAMGLGSCLGELRRAVSSSIRAVHLLRVVKKWRKWKSWKADPRLMVRELLHNGAPVYGHYLDESGNRRPVALKRENKWNPMIKAREKLLVASFEVASSMDALKLALELAPGNIFYRDEDVPTLYRSNHLIAEINADSSGKLVLQLYSRAGPYSQVLGDVLMRAKAERAFSLQD